MAEGDPALQRRDHAALTDREKATLRLLLAGHDAKSIARELGLSVHTVNERLREARRKLGAASSREAARRLAESEGAVLQNLGDARLGVPASGVSMASSDRPERRTSRLAWLIGGMLIMSVLIATVAAIVLHVPASPVAQAPAGVSVAETTPASLDAAKAWLALVDQGKWHASWQTAAAMFRTQIGDARWAEMVTPVRQPLGAVVTRTFDSVERTRTLPGAPGAEYEILAFRTNFAQRSDASETVILVRESEGWRVAGYFIR